MTAKLDVMLPKYQAALERTLLCNLRRKLQNKTHTRLCRATIVERKFLGCYLTTKTTDHTVDTIHIGHSQGDMEL